MSRLTPAREMALEVTRQVRERKAYAQNLIRSQVQSAQIPLEERAFATLLINGVVASRGTLDEIIDRSLDKPSDIRLNVRDVLRITTYELMFLDKDVHAAVDQGVELVRKAAIRAAGLANKVLRRIAADKDAFPWGDPTTDDAALARSQAFPLWLAQRLISDLGRDIAWEFMVASNQQAPLFVAVNHLLGDTDQVIRELEAAGGEPIATDSPSDLPTANKVSTGFRLPNNALKRIEPLISAGKILICDSSAQEVAEFSKPPAGKAFLEVGSGRGTKTVLLQRNAWLENGEQARLVALDLHAFKTQILLQRIADYGLKNVQPVTGDVLELDQLIAAFKLPESYGGALIDAPCSGTGTLRRHPEIRWDLKAETVDSMTSVGLEMLGRVARRIEPGGFVVYSTCSVLRQENEELVDAFLATEEGSNFSLDGSYLRSDLRQGSADAHFAARLVRKA